MSRGVCRNSPAGPSLPHVSYWRLPSRRASELFALAFAWAARVFPNTTAPVVGAVTKLMEIDPMLAFAESNSTNMPAWHAGFLAMLHCIRDRLNFAFSGFTPATREEAIAESLALALDAFIKLFEQGRADIAYPSVLAMYAARQFRTGRRVSGELKMNDVMSPRAQKLRGIVVKPLVRRDRSGAWKEILVADKTCTPADAAVARIDFGDWLSRLTDRNRRLATTLAAGETGRDTARMFGISTGRVAQIRSKLRRNWQAFQGEPADEAGELAMAGC